MDIERFDLTEAISNVIRDYSSNNDNGKNNTIRFFCNDKEVNLSEKNDGKLFINADKTRITRVLSNLLSNATKVTITGAIQILLDTSSSDHISIKIRDDGPGIDKLLLPRLFDKFVTGISCGTGLGLYICKNIIEAHGGKIWTENNQGTKGVTFTFTLPLNNQNVTSS
jgi:two-component system, OmpR family, sensor histidine kinase VicK